MKVMQIGLGSIGKAVTRLLLKKPGWEIAAAFDVDPEKQGQDLGEVAGLDQRLGIPVAGDFLDFQQYGDVDVALVTTVSTLPEILPTLQALMQRGVNIVASAEELFYPHYRYPDEARKLDEMAKKYGVSILGTGVTPGFVMDTLVLMLTGMSQQINRLAVTRVVNASGSRPSLQQKIGIGLTEESFAEQEAQHRVGVVGTGGLPGVPGPRSAMGDGGLQGAACACCHGQTPADGTPTTGAETGLRGALHRQRHQPRQGGHLV